MLLFRDVVLNPARARFDISIRMSPTNNSTEPTDSAAHNSPQADTARGAHPPQEPAAGAPLQAEGLAHELANLLDGSLRHLHLAIDALTKAKPESGVAQDSHLLGRLNTTDQAMQQMATLIHAWMKAAPKPRELFDQPQTLKQVLEQIIDIHRPAATEHAITLDLFMDDTARQVPAGPVFPVIANAIINSIEAIAATPPGARQAPGQVLVRARVELGNVYLIVSDNGPGLADEMIDEQGDIRVGQTTKPEGHGLGLSLSRQVAHSLGGTLTLKNNPAAGVTLTLKYPLTGLDPSS